MRRGQAKLTATLPLSIPQSTVGGYGQEEEEGEPAVEPQSAETTKSTTSPVSQSVWLSAMKNQLGTCTMLQPNTRAKPRLLGPCFKTGR
jgi:hypothetical protein